MNGLRSQAGTNMHLAPREPRLGSISRSVGAKKNAGISLVEIMVGLVVSLIILAAVITVTVSSRVNQEVSYNNLGLQENGRFALQFLSDDLRHAGYFGCSNEIVGGNSISPIVSTAGSAEGTTDSMVINYGRPEDHGVTTATMIPAAIGNSNYAISVLVSDDYCGPAPCDLNDVDENWDNVEQVLISNCSGTALVDVTGVDKANNIVTIAAQSDLGVVFDAGASVKRLFTATYAVADGASGVPSLFRDGVEMVEGIENLQILYRTITGNQSESPSTWADLQGVQLALIARTVSNDRLESNPNREYGITTDAGSHELLGETVTLAALQGSRQIFSSFVARRNN